MDIVHIYKDYYPVLGGIENHIKVLAEAQAAAGYNVTVLACALGRRSSTATEGGVRVVRAGRMATFSSMPISAAQPLALMRMRADVAHVHSPYPLGEVANWLLGKARATVITHHSDVVRQRGWLRLYGPMLRRVLRATDRIIATSPNYIETSPWLNPIREKCCVVPLGVDHQRFTQAPAPFDGPPTLIFVGKLRYYKGIGTLLEALAMLPEVLLEIAGDGPMRDRWEQQVVELNLGGRVRFLGRVDDAALPELYRRAHIFVLPANARAEAFGQVLLEAMASGLACVTTDVGTGTSWVVEDGVTGLVVPPSDPERLAEALRQLMDDSERRLAMGRAGRARVEERFTPARMVQGVQDAYEKALAA